MTVVFFIKTQFYLSSVTAVSGFLTVAILLKCGGEVQPLFCYFRNPATFLNQTRNSSHHPEFYSLINESSFRFFNTQRFGNICQTCFIVKRKKILNESISLRLNQSFFSSPVRYKV